MEITLLVHIRWQVGLHSSSIGCRALCIDQCAGFQIDGNAQKFANVSQFIYLQPWDKRYKPRLNVFIKDFPSHISHLYRSLLNHLECEIPIAIGTYIVRNVECSRSPCSCQPIFPSNVCKREGGFFTRVPWCSVVASNLKDGRGRPASWRWWSLRGGTRSIFCLQWKRNFDLFLMTSITDGAVSHIGQCA